MFKVTFDAAEQGGIIMVDEARNETQAAEFAYQTLAQEMPAIAAVLTAEDLTVEAIAGNTSIVMTWEAPEE